MNTLSRRTIDGKPWPSDYEFWLGGTIPAARGPAAWRDSVSHWLEWLRRAAGRTSPTARNRRPVGIIVSTDPLAERLYFAGFDPVVEAAGRLHRHRRLSPHRATEPTNNSPNPANQAGQAANRVEGTQYVERYGLDPLSRPVELRTPTAVADVSHGRQATVGDQPPRTHVAGRARSTEYDFRRHALDARVECDRRGVGAGRTPAAPPGVTGTLRSTSTTRETPVRLVAMQADTFRAFVADPRHMFMPAAAMPSRRRCGTSWQCGRPRVFCLTMCSATANGSSSCPSALSPILHFNVYWINPETMLLSINAGYWEGGPVNELVWFTADGKVQREETRRVEWLRTDVGADPVLGVLGLHAGTTRLVRHLAGRRSIRSPAATQGGHVRCSAQPARSSSPGQCSSSCSR